MGKGVSVVIWSQYGRLGGVYIIALIELALEIGQAHHDGQVMPYISITKL